MINSWVENFFVFFVVGDSAIGAVVDDDDDDDDVSINEDVVVVPDPDDIFILKQTRAAISDPISFDFLAIAIAIDLAAAVIFNDDDIVVLKRPQVAIPDPVFFVFSAVAIVVTSVVAAADSVAAANLLLSDADDCTLIALALLFLNPLIFTLTHIALLQFDCDIFY